MFFDQYDEFVTQDPRFGRESTKVTTESLSKRSAAILPPWLVKDKVILDLGHCVGAFGHWALSNGASHYIGVDIQKLFCDRSETLMSKYWKPDQYTIINSDILSSELPKKCDVIVAAGVLHGYFDVISVLKRMSELEAKYLVIETLDIEEKTPRIEFKNHNMASPSVKYPYSGWTSVIGIKALSLVMAEYGYSIDGERIYPERIVGSHDAYSDKHELVNDHDAVPSRYIVRFKRNTKLRSSSLQSSIKEKRQSFNSVLYNPQTVTKNTAMWKFDSEVAERFQNEAQTNIPDYERVIDMCIEVAQSFPKSSKIVDVGSALGHTMGKFTQAGYTNIWGIDTSAEMNARNPFKQFVHQSEDFVGGPYDVVLCNWTMHFMIDKESYLQRIYDNTNPGGILILSDKTTQSETIKRMYYDFKRANGVSDDYIKQKEEALKGYMHTVPVDFYTETLQKLGYEVRILNARYGFVTFLAEKSL